jgi:hypothetical protein
LDKPVSRSTAPIGTVRSAPGARSFMGLEDGQNFVLSWTKR